jgi:hypothetical protein
MKTIKIVCLVFSVVAVLITIVFFCWWAMKDRIVFGGESFNQIRWITAAPTPEEPCYRGAMAYDLQQHFLVKGMPRQTATVLLGRPTWEDFAEIEYDLGHCLWDVHGLRLYFDAQDKLVHSRIVQH